MCKYFSFLSLKCLLAILLFIDARLMGIPMEIPHGHDKHVCISLEIFAAFAFHVIRIHIECVNIELETALVYIKQSSHSRMLRLDTFLNCIRLFVVGVICNAYVVCGAQHQHFFTFHRMLYYETMYNVRRMIKRMTDQKRTDVRIMSRCDTVNTYKIDAHTILHSATGSSLNHFHKGKSI